MLLLFSHSFNWVLCHCRRFNDGCWRWAIRTAKQKWSHVLTHSHIHAPILSRAGLAANVTVFIVASMLVSPIMGPILGETAELPAEIWSWPTIVVTFKGMTFGYRIADWKLFKTGMVPFHFPPSLYCHQYQNQACTQLTDVAPTCCAVLQAW